MSDCPMCGTDVPAGGNGRCHLGHRLPAGALVVAGRIAAPLGPPSAPSVADPPPPPPPTPGPEADRGVMHHVLDEALFDAPVGDDIAPAPGTTGADPARALLRAELLSRGPATPGHGRRLLAGALAMVLVVAGTLGWFVLGPGGSDSALANHYRRVFQAGESHDYRMSLHMSGTVEAAAQGSLPLDMTISMTVHERVLDVDSEGNATIRYGMSDLQTDLGGTGALLPSVEGLTFTVRMAPDGRVLEVEGMNSLFGADQLGPAGDLFGPDSMGPILPDGKIAPGSTWTEEVEQKIPYLDTVLKVTSHNKLLSLKTIDGERAAVIRSEIEMPFDVSFDADDIRRLAELGGAGSVGSGAVPGGVSMEMSGGAEMTLLQTIAADTSRPIQVTGDGNMKIEVKLGGAGAGIPAMTMDMAFEIDFSEVPAS